PESSSRRGSTPSRPLSIAAIRCALRAAPSRLGSGTSASKPGTPSCVAASGSVECTTSKNSSLSRASRADACPAAASPAPGPPGGGLCGRSVIFPAIFSGNNGAKPVSPRGEQAPQVLPGTHPLPQPANAHELVRGVQLLIGGREREEQRLDR